MASLAKTAGNTENSQEIREEEFSEKKRRGSFLRWRVTLSPECSRRPLIKRTKLYSSILYAAESSIFRSESMLSEKRKRTSAARSIQSMFE